MPRMSRDEWIGIHSTSLLVGLAVAIPKLAAAWRQHVAAQRLDLALSAAQTGGDEDKMSEAARQRREEWIAITGQAVDPTHPAPSSSSSSSSTSSRSYPLPFGSAARATESSSSSSASTVAATLRSLTGREVALAIEKDDVLNPAGLYWNRFARVRQAPGWGIAPLDAGGARAAPIHVDRAALARSIDSDPDARALELREAFREERRPWTRSSLLPGLDFRLLKRELIVPLLSTVTVVGRLSFVDGQLSISAHDNWGMFLLGGGLWALKDTIFALKRKRNTDLLTGGAFLGLCAVNVVSLADPGFFERQWSRLARHAERWKESLVNWWNPELRRRALEEQHRVAQRWAGAAAATGLTEIAEMAADGEGAREGGTSAFAVGAISQQCIVCYERKVDTAFSPCGHLTCCSTCAARINGSPFHAERRCPLCRRNISSLLRVFAAGIPIEPPPPQTNANANANANGNGNGNTDGETPVLPASPAASNINEQR